MKYIFFDLDETLIDIKTAQNKAVENLFYKYSFDKVATLPDFIKKWDELTEYHYSFYTKKLISYSEQRKRRIDDLFKFFNTTQNKDSLKIYDDYLVFFEKEWCLFNDVLPLLNHLKEKGYTLGIISNGDIAQQKQKLKNTKIDNYFTYINTSSEFEISKPNPKLFFTIFEKHDINFEDVIYIGDSYEKDISPCLSLGIKTILIDRNNKYQDINDCDKITSLINLINLI